MLTHRDVLTVIASVPILFGFGASVPDRAAANETAPAYFVFEQESPEKTINRFVFKLVDAVRIEEARAILAGQGGDKRSVQGIVIQSPAPYNPQWSYHLDPPTISFFEIAIEVCDANMTYVEEHLDEVGGSFLPGSHWCPWSSQLVAEVTDQIDPETEEPRP